MKRLILFAFLFYVLLLAACGGKETEAPIPIPTTVPPCETQLNIRVGYFNDKFVEVSSESFTVELEYDEWAEEYYIPNNQRESIYHWYGIVEDRLHDYFLDIPIEREYQGHFEECPMAPVKADIFVYWSHVTSYTKEGVTVNLTPETLEKIIRGQEISQVLPPPLPISPEEFSAAVTKAAATYQVSANHIGQATTLFNLAAQEGEYMFITTLSNDSLWGALIPSD